MIGRILVFSTILLFSMGKLVAQSAVKSVDQAGNVTYSDRAVPGSSSSREVKIEAGPTALQTREAQERAQKMREQADQAQKQREALASQREAERSATHKYVSEPQVEVIEDSGYSTNRRPVRPVPPIAKPPAGSPPVARPLPAAR